MKMFSRLTFTALSLLLLIGCAEVEKQPKYVFYFIGDGMGLNIIHGTEYYKAAQKGMKLVADTVAFAHFPTVGIVNTSSSNSYVTDSGAAGTALACGQKTKQGTIGMDSTQVTPIKSIAVRAKEQGYGVAVLSSVSIDHATPAAFYAHNKSRGNCYEIAIDGATSGLDILGGSGFLNPTKEGKQPVYDAYKAGGYTHFAGKDKLGDILSCDTKILITERSDAPQSSFAYAVDRTEKDLSLSDLVAQSIKYLYNKYSEKGFLIVAEGGMIDWAAHSNDYPAAVGEVLDLDAAVALAYEFYKKHPEETLIVVTADHETGGYANGRSDQGYSLFPDRIDENTTSKESYKALIAKEIAKKTKFDALPLPLGVKFSEKDLKQLADVYTETPAKFASLAYQLISKQVGAGWTTGGHTGSPVMIFSVGSSQAEMGGHMDNTDIPKKLAKMLNI